MSETEGMGRWRGPVPLLYRNVEEGVLQVATSDRPGRVLVSLKGQFKILGPVSPDPSDLHVSLRPLRVSGTETLGA